MLTFNPQANLCLPSPAARVHTRKKVTRSGKKSGCLSPLLDTWVEKFFLKRPPLPSSEAVEMPPVFCFCFSREYLSLKWHALLLHMRLTYLPFHFSSLKRGHTLSSFLHDLYRDLFYICTEKQNKTKEKIKRKMSFPKVWWVCCGDTGSLMWSGSSPGKGKEWIGWHMPNTGSGDWVRNVIFILWTLTL